MEVFLKKPEQRMYELNIHLTNTSPETVTVNTHDLPWVPPNDAQWLLAFRLNSPGFAIQQNFPHGKVGSRIIRLLPGESIQDKIVLNPRIPSLLRDIEQFGVRVHWDCPPPGLKFVCKEGSPHSITIPKGDTGQADVYVVDAKVCEKLERTIGLINIPQGHEVLFLLTTESVMTEIQQVQNLLYQVDDYIRQCQPRWTNSWAVSFFTEEQMAGFLKDKESKHFFEQGQWQKGNIGQYSSQIRTLFRFPWIKKKSDSVYLSVYR